MADKGVSKRANIILYKVLHLLLYKCNIREVNLDKDSKVIFWNSPFILLVWNDRIYLWKSRRISALNLKYFMKFHLGNDNVNGGG